MSCKMWRALHWYLFSTICPGVVSTVVDHCGVGPNVFPIINWSEMDKMRLTVIYMKMANFMIDLLEIFVSSNRGLAHASKLINTQLWLSIGLWNVYCDVLPHSDSKLHYFLTNTPPTQPPARPPITWILNCLELWRKEGKWKGVKKQEGKKERQWVDFECGPAQPSLLLCFVFVLANN